MNSNSILLRGLTAIKRRLRATAKGLQCVLFRYPVVHTASGVLLRADRKHPNWTGIIGRGFHERDIERFFGEYLEPGDTIFDVGANVGILSAICGKLVGPQGVVHAFEVDQSYAVELEATVKRNGLANVRIHNFALGDSCGLKRFVKPDAAWGAFMVGTTDPAASGSNKRKALDSYFSGQSELEYEAEVTTVDEFVRRNTINQLSVIKVDVDGPEYAVLAGASDSIARFSPALLVELSMFTLDHAASLQDFFDFLSSRNYLVYAAVRGSDDVKQVRSPDDLPANVRTTKVAVDLICLLPNMRQPRNERLWFLRTGAHRAL